MKRFYYKFRVILLTLALGLASVAFFNSLYERWNKVSVVLPQTESESPIYVQLKNPPPLEPSLRYNPDLINQHRDLSLYEFGGSNWSCENYSSENVQKCKKVRNYIWQHWKEKKRTYIILEFISVDSGNRAHIFIEPDKNGQWHIDWKWEYLSAYDLEDSGNVDIRSVKFKKAKEDSYRLRAGVNYLSFLDKDNNEVESW